MAVKKKAPAAEMDPLTPASATAVAAPDGDAAEVAGRFIGQWNRLVSTTNWAKGRIICQWREALIEAGAAVTEYSDEAWSQLVGGVTSQHVGRLRRVYHRFGESFEQFDGLFWSHFQAAIDWEDAEMWLEGAIHNSWSVSQMRGKRWETVGKPGEASPVDDEAALAAEESAADEAPFDDDGETVAAVTATPSAVKPVAKPAQDAADDDEDDQETATGGSDDRESPKSPAKSRNRLPVEVDELPDDIADAFEQFKLAIIAQRRLSWSETTPELVLECLDALRQLTLAPLDD